MTWSLESKHSKMRFPGDKPDHLDRNLSKLAREHLFQKVCADACPPALNSSSARSARLPCSWPGSQGPSPLTVGPSWAGTRPHALLSPSPRTEQQLAQRRVTMKVWEGKKIKIVAIPDLSKKKKVFKVSSEGNGRPLKGLSREWRDVQIKVKFRFDPKISLMPWLSS